MNIVEIPDVPAPSSGVCWATFHGLPQFTRQMAYCTLPTGHAGKHQWETDAEYVRRKRVAALPGEAQQEKGTV